MATTDAAFDAGALEAYIAQQLRDWDTPGTAVAVAREGELVLLKGFGQRNLAEDLPVTTDTVFSIASCSKAICCASLAVLVDDGKLDWDVPVQRYLPDFALFDASASARITPRDLVTHRSGLPRHDGLWYGSTLTRDEMIHRLRYVEPTKDLRQVWQYQNLMYLAAGYLAGKINGTSWEELVQTRLFDPLGMTNSAFSVLHAQQSPDHARPYAEREGETREIPFRNIDAIAPAGAIVSSIADMSQWLLLNLNQGRHDGRRIISPEQIAQLRQPQMIMPNWNKYPESSLPAYAFGWAVESYRGHTKISHGGNIDGFTSLVTFLPDAGIGVVVLTNKNQSSIPTAVTLTAVDQLLGLPAAPWAERFRQDYETAKAAGESGKERAEAETVPGTQPSHLLAAYAGAYEHPGYGRLLIEEKEEGLSVRFNAMAGPLTHRHSDVFEYDYVEIGARIPLNFAADVTGDIVSVAAPIEPMVKEIVFTRQPPPEMREHAFLARLTGTYDFNGQPLTVTFKDEATLQVAIPGLPVADLAPRRGTDFRLKDRSGMRVEFTLPEQGEATAVAVMLPTGLTTAPRRRD